MLSSVPGAEKGFNEIGDGLLNRVRARAERFNDWVELERLTFSERYAIGRLDICLVFEVGAHTEGVKGSVIGVAALKQSNLFCLRISKAHDFTGCQKGSLGRSGEPLIQHLFWEIYDLAGKNEKTVFVAGVEAVKPAQDFIPARIRLERLYQLDDICAGEIYLSAFDSVLKPFRFSNEREHEFEGTGGFIVRHSIERHIEGGAEVVNHIANNERQVIGNGFVPSANDGVFAGVGLVLDDGSKRSLSHKGIDGCLKLADVIFGPLDFKLGCEGQRASGGEAHGKIRSDERPRISKSGADIPAHETEAA
jgi:hypothetical protein